MIQARNATDVQELAIRVKYMGNLQEVKVTQNEMGIELQEKIALIFGVTVNSFHLMYAGKTIGDRESLSSLNIGQNSIVHAIAIGNYSKESNIDPKSLEALEKQHAARLRDKIASKSIDVGSIANPEYYANDLSEVEREVISSLSNTSSTLLELPTLQHYHRNMLSRAHETETMRISDCKRSVGIKCEHESTYKTERQTLMNAMSNVSLEAFTELDNHRMKLDKQRFSHDQVSDARENVHNEESFNALVLQGEQTKGEELRQALQTQLNWEYKDKVETLLYEAEVLRIKISIQQRENYSDHRIVLLDILAGAKSEMQQYIATCQTELKLMETSPGSTPNRIKKSEALISLLTYELEVLDMRTQVELSLRDMDRLEHDHNCKMLNVKERWISGLLQVYDSMVAQERISLSQQFMSTRSAAEQAVCDVRSRNDASLWTSDSKGVSLIDFRNFTSFTPDQMGADDTTKSILAQKPAKHTRDISYAQDKNFISQLLCGVAISQGCNICLRDSSTASASNIVSGMSDMSLQPASSSDDMQYASSLAPHVGNVDAKDIKQLVLDKPDGEWEGIDTKTLLSDELARNVYIRSVQGRIARALRTTTDQVQILEVREGSVVFTFSYKGQVVNHTENFTTDESENVFRREFTTFSAARVHPLHSLLNFDLANISTAPQACKDFTNLRNTFEVGPPDRRRRYHQPTGYIRMGLNVLGKYGADNTWLEPFDTSNSSKTWYRAYHGTSRNAFSQIADGGFNPSNGGKLGPGVYVSPHASYAERYTTTVNIKFKDGTISRFRVLIMCAVRPGSITREGYKLTAEFADENSEWVIASAADVRPYGILFRKMD